ncbi:MAG: PQQ-like beta-propeller repeat protein [Phycisphaerae bacterium]|nr:PQQ-like beta-propeller repeat protein [Phycisphaerae bacterium]HON92524.1 PQQ-like beta-propeller repeat protein [Sedimentisphaerales bacterium]
MRKNVIRSMLVVTMVFVVAVQAADCPRFRGPAGDGQFFETGLLKQWPQDGPKLVWTVQGLGKGYSSATVAGGTIYVTGMDDQKQGVLFAFNLDGSPKWKTPYGPELEKQGAAVAGTRATPTVDGDRVYLLTGFAKLVAFDAAKGQVLKTVDLVERFKPKQAQFGFADSVLVDGNRLICSPGGPDASVVALDKNSGQTLWQTKGLSQTTGYCSARIVEWGGRRLVLTMLGAGVVAVDAETGEVVWQHDYPHRASVQPNPPLYADGMVFVSSGMGAGSAMLSLAETNPTAVTIWAEKALDCQMQGTVLIDGCIYGTAQSANKGLVCLDWKTGKVLWNAPEVKQGTVTSADGMLYVYGVDGTMRLVKPSRTAYEPVGQFTVSAGTDEHWAHPTIANGRLYIRHGDALVVYDLKS